MGEDWGMPFSRLRRAGGMPHLPAYSGQLVRWHSVPMFLEWQSQGQKKNKDEWIYQMCGPVDDTFLLGLTTLVTQPPS